MLTYAFGFSLGASAFGFSLGASAFSSFFDSSTLISPPYLLLI